MLVFYHLHMLFSDHLHAADAFKQKTFEQCRVSAHSKSQKAVEAAVINTYFAAKTDMASSRIPNLNELCIDQVWFAYLYLLVIAERCWQVFFTLCGSATQSVQKVFFPCTATQLLSFFQYNYTITVKIQPNSHKKIVSTVSVVCICQQYFCKLLMLSNKLQDFEYNYSSCSKKLIPIFQ